MVTTLTHPLAYIHFSTIYIHVLPTGLDLTRKLCLLIYYHSIPIFFCLFKADLLNYYVSGRSRYNTYIMTIPLIIHVDGVHL